MTQTEKLDEMAINFEVCFYLFQDCLFREGNVFDISTAVAHQMVMVRRRDFEVGFAIQETGSMNNMKVF
jgi:hypothetical protein